MHIAIDISAIKKTQLEQHKVRGFGTYIEGLKSALSEYFPQHSYTYFVRGEKLPKNIDIIHYPCFEPFFLTLPFYQSVPHVVTVHDLIPLVFPDHFPSGIRGRLKWEIQKQVLKRSSAIITVSMASKKDIIRLTGLPDSKISVVYLAPAKDFKRFTNHTQLQEVRTKYGLPQSFALYVGDGTWNKNLTRIAEATLKSNIPLVMVGKALSMSLSEEEQNNLWNNELVELQKLAVRNNNIILTGFVPVSELVALYNLATVFVMPSLYEGFGLPIVEAMACELPIVTSKAGSLEEIAGKAAYYVDPRNADDIAKGMQTVFNSRELQESLSSRGNVGVKKFSWKKTAEQTMEVYKKVVNN